ncbi:MAG: aminoacyl-tRNA hydrolase [Oscillospiraceae bacterium]|jgi:PTH1 family peptidyl-tRNA hydrolase|nr:aminoacyl-tRNA hydrolase [Oscillospiraceae bacterium]
MFFYKSKAKLMFVGLGNTGIPYDGTRHNLGFFIIDRLAQRLGTQLRSKKSDGAFAKVTIERTRALLLKPLLLMNNSGIVIHRFANYFGISAENIIVIHDDITIPAGQFKVKVRGSDGGHNGIKSVIDFLDTPNFPRIKCGVGAKAHPQTTLSDWVLSRFNPEETEKIGNMLPQILACIDCIAREGVAQAMNTYNQRNSNQKGAPIV